MESLITVASWRIILVTFAIYLGSLGFYRLFLHPLARFPGPKLAAVTRWYEGYYDVVQNGRYTFQIAKMHQQYGPIIRISPHELHIHDSSFFNTLYRQEGRWDRYAWAWDAWAAEGPTIHTVNHERHKARRQPLAVFFSRAKVANHQDKLQQHLNKFCDRLSRIAESGGTVNLGAATTALARDVAFDFMLAKSYNGLDREEFDDAVLHAVQGVGPIWRISKHVRFVFPLLNAMPLEWAMKISDDKMKIFFKHMKTIMKDTKELMTAASSAPEVGSQRTIVHEILESKLPPHDKSFQRVFEDVTSVSGAGVETISAALRLLFFHVFSDKRILQKLRKELNDAQADHPDGMELRVLEQLPFLTSTLKEGLRLSPGIATRMARVAPDRDLFYKEWRIPAGTPVGMTSILMHTDEQLYPEPRSFKPERWMDVDGRRNAEEAYAPFSKGTRMCLGIHLAWAELYLVLAALVHRFDFEFKNAKAQDFECASDNFVIGTTGNGVLEAHVLKKARQET